MKFQIGLTWGERCVTSKILVLFDKHTLIMCVNTLGNSKSTN